MMTEFLEDPFDSIVSAEEMATIYFESLDDDRAVFERYGNTATDMHDHAVVCGMGTEGSLRNDFSKWYEGFSGSHRGVCAPLEECFALVNQQYSRRYNNAA